MSDVQTDTRRPESQQGTDRRTQLLTRLQQISQSNQSAAYGPVAQLLLDEIDPVRLVSALLSQLAATPGTTPISQPETGRRPQPRRTDVARMA